MRRPTGNPSARLALIALLLVLVAATAVQSRPFVPVQDGFVPEAPDVSPYAPGRLIVKFSEQGARSALFDVELRRGAEVPNAVTGIASVDALGRELGVTRIERQLDAARDGASAAAIGLDRWFIMHLPESADVEAAADRLRDDPAVEHASPDWRIYPATIPNDPLYPDQWGHNNTGQMLSYDWATYSHENGDPVGTPGFDSNAEAAWSAAQGYGSSGVIIAVLDSGVDVDHPDLRLVAGYDFGDGDSNPDDDSGAPGHGTCCAGVAASIANNGTGGSGIAGGCSVMPVKLANSSGSMYVSTMAPAIIYAADNGADIISMSIGMSATSEPTTDDAILYAHNAGVTILAATGNYNDSVIDYPAINQYVIGVGAASPCGERKRSSSSIYEVNQGVETDPNGYTCDGERWWGSNYGSTTRDAAGAVDVIAPTIMPTTDIGGNGGYASGDYEMWFNGTSCSTPYAAGVCALIVSANPTFTADQVRERLVTTAQDVISVESGAGWDRYAGYGMVDAEAAVGGSQPQPPVAEFSADPTSGSPPLTVDFTDLSSGEPTSWNWDFGDGVGSSTAQNPTYTYTELGTYTVTLTAANAYGSDSETKVDCVVVAENVRAYASSETSVAGSVSGDYTDTHASDDVREVITEVAYTGHPRKTYSYLEHRWTFSVPSGDAVTFYLEAYRPASSDGDDFLFEYSTDGATYTPLVTVASASEQVYSVPLASPVSGTVYVRATDTVRAWDTTSNDALYVDCIYFEVGGGEPQPPVANFTGDPASGYAPLTVHFTDTSTGSPTSWSWDFGDGVGTSTEQNPDYTYGAIGAYTVTLTATNEHGSDVETKVDYITVNEQGEDAVHVSDMSIDRALSGRFWRGVADVAVVDDGGAPAAGATVYGFFNEPSTVTKSAVTGADGVAHILGDKSKDSVSDFCFEVTDVVFSGYTYDPAANAVTRACESGWTLAEAGDAFDVTDTRLFFNRPNPFRGETTIAFSLAEAGHVTIEIFNVAGRLVDVIADRTFGAGVHSATWSAGGNASGMYFCRMTTGDRVDQKAMVLLK